MNTRTGMRAVALALCVASGASAATFQVTTTDDTDDGSCDAHCSLREAVIASNAAEGADEILLPAGVYGLTIAGTGEDASRTGDLDVNGDLTVTGAGAPDTIIDGNELDSIFEVGNGDEMLLQGVTLTRGRALHGGAIRANFQSVLTVRASRLTGNTATGDGGAIYANDGVFVEDSTIDHNVATFAAGAIAIETASGGFGSGDLVMRNVTVTNNQGGDTAGGIAVRGTIDMRHSTLSGNQLASVLILSDLTGRESVFGNNLVYGVCFRDAPLTPAPISLGGNIEGPGSTCGFRERTDRSFVVAPLYGPLADNGGPTPTHALLPGSPAIDHGVNEACELTDQRGVQRPQGRACDAGAFEVESAGGCAVAGGGAAASSTAALGLLGLAIARRRLRRARAASSAAAA